MAGNKVNKAKGKYDKSKSTSIMPSNDETEEYDFSLLRKPIQTSITGLGQARKIFDLATEELKKLLSDECDVLYECKVCRNIFRSLANFISHKRVYCKETFDLNQHGHFIQQMPTHLEIKKIQQTEEAYHSLQKNNTIEAHDSERIPLTKDLTTIIEKIAKRKSSDMKNKDFQVALQEIPTTSVAVFQNLENGLEKDTDNMLNQVSELEKMISNDMGVMQIDGNFKIESSADVDNNVIQISDDEDCANTINLKCKICDMQFSTQKTLKFHMKYKHMESRLVYPCPDCLEIFSTSWSVYRHLFKVHRKSAAQIRRLRESIQAKAFKMNNPPAFYERRKNNLKATSAPKITEEERIEQENQAWMDNMEFDGSYSRCGGCGRTFERRAALAAHAHTCRRPRRADPKRIEIQIRKDYNKGPNANLNLLKLADSVDKIKDEPTEENEKEPTENELEKSSLEKEPLEKEPQEKDTTEKESIPKDIKIESVETEAENEPVQMEIDEKVAEQADENVDLVTLPSEEDSTPTESPEKTETLEQPEIPKTPSFNLPHAQQAEKSNLVALRQRIVCDIELDKLKCKRCNTHCDHIRNLYDHVAEHYKWMRYACKLCNFKHYYFDQLPEHVKTVHKLKGDKDFYYSTVKAIDGPEATELSEDPVEESNEESPESRRPSRCSSDSSRLSDDSSSSGIKVENSRKRKVQQNSRYGKRKRESNVKSNNGVDENESTNQKTYEENSSDIDYDDKVEKTQIIQVSSVASRRPVRRKTKPKNADFEYDLSNLLKMEAQGYRENQTNSSTTNTKQTRKKIQNEAIGIDILNKECLGALDTMSRKAVEGAKAEIKTSSFAVYSHTEKVTSNVFVRPMLPRTMTKGEKNSPKKDINDDKDNSPSKENKNKSQNEESPEKEDAKASSSGDTNTIKEQNQRGERTYGNKTTNKEQANKQADDPSPTKDSENNATTNKALNPKNKTITPVVPIKFRRQSLDVMKNPLINQNIKEFTKAGMKTKILVIKPIKMKDGTQSVNTPLKFQRIKLKDPNRKSTGEDASSDQVVVVKVPNVERNIVLASEKKIAHVENQNAKLEMQNTNTGKQNTTIEKENTNIEKKNAITEKSEEPTVKSPDTQTAAVNGQSEVITTPVSTEKEQNKDVSENSDFSLHCNEDIRKVDLTSAENKEIVKEVDSETTTSNGVS